MKQPIIQANPSDEQLLRWVVDKDAYALEVLYDRHAQAVLQLLQRIVRNRQSAEDLVQETFWQVWQKAEQYQGTGAVSSWIFRVARNKAIDHLRVQKARPRYIPDSLEMLEPSAQGVVAGVESDVEAHWLSWQLQQMVDRLPSKQRLCFELAYFQGMSQSEIATYTDTPLGTVKTRMRIGMEKLVRLFNQTPAFVGAH